jgi:hypothetical protein
MASEQDKPALKELPIDLDEVAAAMDHLDRSQTDHFLNLQTGEVITLSTRLLEAVRAGVKPEDTDLPEWQWEDTPLAEAVARDSQGASFARIPEARWTEDHRLKVRFAQAVKSEGLRELVAMAVYAHDGGLKFDELLVGYPQLRATWYRFQARHKREWARRWLLLLGIAPREIEIG